MLEKEFYKLKSSDIREGILMCEISINSAHPLFDGHFPSRPIVPGVVQMEIVKELLGRSFSKEFRYTEIRSCKFITVLNPIENSDVSFRIKLTTEQTVPDRFSVDVIVFYDETVFMKLQAKLAHCGVSEIGIIVSE